MKSYTLDLQSSTTLADAITFLDIATNSTHPLIEEFSDSKPNETFETVLNIIRENDNLATELAASILASENAKQFAQAYNNLKLEYDSANV